MESKNEGTRVFSWRESLCPLAAGLLGGAVSTTLLLPLDVIKVRMQVHEDSSPSSHKRTSTDLKTPSTKRLNSIRLAQGILRHEGWRGLYQGLSPAVVGASIAWGGYFFFYEGCKQQLSHYYEKQYMRNLTADAPPPKVVLSSLDNFGLACSAGAVMVFITNPIWLIKTRMQLQMKETAKRYGARKEPYKGLFDAFRTIVREEGFWALYKGTVPALLLTSHGGVQFVVYEYLKLYFDFKRLPRSSEGNAKLPVMERLQQSLGYLTMGAVAKIVASTATYPLQVIKSRIQQRSESVELTAEGNVRLVRREYSGLFKTIVRMWRKEGILGFFKGCIPNAIRVAPGAAITFVVYESAMDWCR